MSVMNYVGINNVTDTPECRAEMMRQDMKIAPQAVHTTGEFLDTENLTATHAIKGRTEIAGAVVRYTIELPDEVIDPVPVIYINGFCGAKGAYHVMRTNTAQRGKPAVTFHSPRGQKIHKRLSPDGLVRPHLLQSKAVWSVMRDLDYDMYDLAGHSMGGKTLVDLANHKADRVRSALFIASAGLDVAPGTHHTMLEMATRGRDFLKYELKPSFRDLADEKRMKVAKQAAHYVFRDVVRTAQEAYIIARSNIGEDVRNLGQLGIKTAGLAFEQDAFFHLSDMLKYNEKAFDLFEIYDDPQGKHISPQLHAVSVAETSLNILHKLNKPSPKAA